MLCKSQIFVIFHFVLFELISICKFWYIDLSQVCKMLAEASWLITCILIDMWFTLQFHQLNLTILQLGLLHLLLIFGFHPLNDAISQKVSSFFVFIIFNFIPINPWGELTQHGDALFSRFVYIVVLKGLVKEALYYLSVLFHYHLLFLFACV